MEGKYKRMDGISCPPLQGGKFAAGRELCGNGSKEVEN